MSSIRVPELGESIVEATILTWLKHAGDAVEAGDAVAELETDKVNVEVMAEEQGILGVILKPEGETVQVGEAIAELQQAAQVALSAPAANESTATAGATESRTAPVGAKPAQVSESANSAATAGVSVSSGRTGAQEGEDAHNDRDVSATPERATPSMRRLAREHGTVAEVAGMQQAARPDEERQRMSRRRLTIATRLVEAQRTSAMLTTFNEVDMSAIMKLRSARKENFKNRHGVSLGFMSFFTKATVAALRAFPRLNAEIDGKDMILKHHYDIGVAVSTEGGLVVPVVRDADRLSFADIEREIGRLAGLARDNRLGLADLQGGTFTVTNGGVFGSLFSTPILNPPQVGILGMHSIKERPAAVDGKVEIRPMMYIALSYDHRIVDGAEAVQFLAMVKELVEDPESLLIEG
ncbi:2-oxoglutarate dehydrogenase complex dihydrolipoyllysine-residue succinyltransferase [Alicyclobacillus sp. ALC3]|uniref:2-oxoglutarate dehydrogenase complex dihydrolipoyllysine-residue succinyltransferase n=1 Tax=Alicyclobacillus sp. ALC3 TaxID=2796143 RepID=UPI0023784769|nr:2-oxoglutarate dehydrogenase complex dihydrolipoyllysine-residue succinyltransferase [Alicyclobacillus sp. ALC3]WDL97566.1 2-oxoglutarate dehydrogenase complex dihydrolipoyllysine-residue succinyltransferase [Alicyclobacillus sp. ALC3]